MSQSGFTPIQLYRSSTAAAAPTAGNLVAGELAINTTDEKLYFENTGGTVTLLASSAAAGGTFTTVTATTVVNGLGAVGTPSYTFTGDLNTGMWSPAADTVAVSTAGAERLRTTSAGNFLVGTTSAAIYDTNAGGDVSQFFKAQFTGGGGFTNYGAAISNGALDAGLGIFGDNSASKRLRIAALQSGYASNTAGAETSYAAFATMNAGVLAERMRLTAAGNLGLGTSSPSEKLEVVGVAKFRTSGGNGIQIVSDTTPYIQSFGASGNNVLQLNGQSISFWSGASFGAESEKMRLDASGNLGIGNTPGVKLDVTGSAIRVSNTTTYNASSAVRFDIGASNDGSVDNSAAYQWSMNTSGNAGGQSLLFSAYRRADTTLEAMRINGSGEVSIGTILARSRLCIARNSSTATVGASASIVLSNRNTTLNGGIAGGIFIDTFRDVADPHYTGGVWFTRTPQVGNFSSSSDIVFGAANTIDVNALPTERMRISGFTGHVGIGTVGPGSRLQVEDASPARGIVETIRATGGTGAQVHFSQDGVADWALGQPAGVNALAFFSGRNPVTDGTERMRIDSSGNVGIGTSAPAYKLDVVGTISANGGMRPVFLVGSSVGNSIFWDGAQFYPGIDGGPLLGFPSFRWNTVYATTGTINTSDGNEKQDINLLNDAEKNVAVRLKSLVRSFKFNDAVAAKGAAARVHFGLVAQDVASAFDAEGLDPQRYAMFCSDTWYEVDGKPSTDVNDPFTKDTEGAVEKTRLGIRYDELIVFMISVL